jgi:ribosomal protein L21
MYAVIKTGGKQYKVAANDEITVEKIDANEGDEHAFEEVLMLGDGDDVTVGAPTVKGAAVVGEVVGQGKGDKVIIFKKRQRSTYKRKKGHRQLETTIKITAILPEGVDVKKLKKADKKTKSEEKVVIKEEAPKAKKSCSGS